MTKQIIIGLLFIFPFQVTFSQEDSLKFGLKGKIIRSLSKTKATPTTFYAGLKGDNFGAALIYKSEDAGKTWFPINNGKSISPYASDIQAISIANDSKSTIYAGTWKDGLFKSTDHGKTWKRDKNIPSSDIRSIQSGIQTPLLVYASTSAFGVLKSIDGGETWKRNDPKVIESTFKFAWSIELDKNNDSIIYAQTFNKGVWQSMDQGDSWKKILDTKGQVSWDLKISEDSKSLWVAASKSGDSISSVYHSENQGKTWREINNVPQIGVSQINVIERKKEKIIFLGSWTNGIFVFENEAWKKMNEVDFDVISEIVLNDNELLIGSWGNGIYNVKL